MNTFSGNHLHMDPAWSVQEHLEPCGTGYIVLLVGCGSKYSQKNNRLPIVYGELKMPKEARGRGAAVAGRSGGALAGRAADTLRE
jgi:hypothetical protein